MFKRFIAFLGTKIGISLVVAFLLVGAATFVVYGPDKKDDKTDASVAAVDLIKKSLDVDADADGLKDWEEAIYGTDPAKPDTDNDGMSDNDEIKANRSPLVAGAGEGAKVEAAATSSLYASNATDRFSQELFTKYLEAKSSGKEITEELSNAIAEEVLAQQYDAFIEPFDVSKLNLVQDNAQNARIYGNRLGIVLLAPPVEGAINELVILERVQAGSATANDRAVLGRIMARYAKMSQELVGMNVPAGAASVHAELIQAIGVMHNVSVGISALDTDPIGAYSKIAQYEDGLNLISSASIKLKSYLVSSGAQFSIQESGYPLAQ